MTDPFVIDGPTCYSFSTGRSSGYGLRRVLDANAPEVLRQYLRVLTCNTGKEEQASLVFGDRVDREWLRPLGLSVTWLEYRPGAEFAVVPFTELSTNGEPFEAVIAQRGGTLPNPRSRYCSSELKTRTMHRYLRSIGWTEWETMIGVRADEQRRVAKFRFNPHPETKDEYVRIPLADAFVTAQQVGDFWKVQPFDLELPNNNGKTMHGNCDLCMLKPAAQIASLIAEKPERAVWWAKQEELAETRLPPLTAPVMEAAPDDRWERWTAAIEEGRWEYADNINLLAPPPQRQKIGLDGNPMFELRPNTGARFRIDRPSYSEMSTFAASQRDAFDPNEEAISCFCGD